MRTYLFTLVIICFFSCSNNSQSDEKKTVTNIVKLNFVFNNDTLFLADKDLDSLLTLPDAYKLTQGLTIDGYSDWRIPSIEELEYIYKNKIAKLDSIWYWSYGKEREMFSHAFNFKDGSKMRIKFRSRLKVRLIRGGKIDFSKGIETNMMSNTNRIYSGGIDTLQLINSIPLIDLPFNDTSIAMLGSGILIDSNMLSILSIDKQDIYQRIGNEDKIVKAICLVNFSEKFVSLVIKIISMPQSNSGENYLLTYNDSGLVDICPFGGECYAQCDCFQFLNVYRNQIKIITHAPCPSESESEEIETEYVGVQKYIIDRNGEFEQIQRYSKSYDDFIQNSSFYEDYYYVKNIGMLKESSDFAFIYASNSNNSGIEGIVLKKDKFKYWNDINKDWYFIETNSGLEGFIRKCDLQ